MKKTMVRIVAALLVAMLALTLIPLGALAATVEVWEGISEDTKPERDDIVYTDVNNDGNVYVPIDVTSNSVTIKTSDYNSHVIIGGNLYDLKGLGIYSEYKDGKEIKTYSSVKVDKFNADDSWYNKWSDGIDVIYTAHQHKLSRWYSDGTTHWKECLVCKNYWREGFHQKFMYQNWCQDGDEDGICNICGGDVPYHDVTVVEEEGGKIIVNRDNACHRMKITADVEPAEGYKLKKLHFTKIRDNGSEQEITRYKKNGQFWTYMPTYELEVSAEFVKVKTKK